MNSTFNEECVVYCAQGQNEDLSENSVMPLRNGQANRNAYCC